MAWYERWRKGKDESLVAGGEEQSPKFVETLKTTLRANRLSGLVPRWVKLPKFTCVIIRKHKPLLTPRELWKETDIAAVCRRCGKGLVKSGWNVPDGLERLARWEAGEK